MGNDKSIERINLDRGADPCAQTSPMEIRRVIEFHITPLGNKGFEIFRVGDYGSWVELMKPEGERTSHSIWEYRLFPKPEAFNTFIDIGYHGGYNVYHGEAWDSHLNSCGWVLIEEAWRKKDWLYDDILGTHLYKRSEHWGGHDDGDIGYQIQAQWGNYFGGKQSFRPLKSWVPLFADVLKMKWHLSEDAGHDVGTFETIRAYFEMIKKSDKHLSLWCLL